MTVTESFDPVLFSRLVDSLYIESMVMADEARSYFDGEGVADREKLDVMMRLSFACESLKVTTRLMHVIAWLLSQKAWRRGEILDADMEGVKYRLGEASANREDIVHQMPVRARRLMQTSQSLYERVRRLHDQIHSTRKGNVNAGADAEEDGGVDHGPARELLARLRRSF